MKRILFITAFVPDNRSAGQYYTLRLLKDLGLSYKIDIIYFRRPNDPPIPNLPNVETIHEYTDSLAAKLANVFKIPFLHPFFANRFSWSLLRLMNKIIHNYEIVYFDFSQTFIYSSFLRHEFKYLMAHDCVAQLYSRKSGLFAMQSYFWVRFTEGLILKKSNSKLICFSEKDQGLFRKLYGTDSRRVNFYLDPLISLVNIKNISPDPNTFCIYGSWSRLENWKGLIWLIKNVIPKVSEIYRFKVIGPGLNDKLKKRMPSCMTYLGFVDNPYKELAHSAGQLVPLSEGAGVKFKVIQSLACGTPVAGTDVAFEGIDYNNHKAMLRCNNAISFIRAIEELSATCNIEDRLELQRDFYSKYQNMTFRKILEERGQ